MVSLGAYQAASHAPLWGDALVQTRDLFEDITFAKTHPVLYLALVGASNSAGGTLNGILICNRQRMCTFFFLMGIKKWDSPKIVHLFYQPRLNKICTSLHSGNDLKIL